jgi:hypothetical protein
MNPDAVLAVLIMVQSDPRQSPRPAEAMRLAAGLGSWGQVQVTVGLRGAALLLLANDDEDIIDGLQVRQCLPVIAAWNRPVLCEANSPYLPRISADHPPLRVLTDEQWAEELLTYRHTLRF